MSEKDFKEDIEDFEECEEDIVFQNISLKELARKRRHDDKRIQAKYRRFSKGNLFPMPAWGVDKNGKYTDDEEEIVYYKRYYASRHSDMFRYCKRQTNKKIRRLSNEINYKGNKYKKCFDMWWTIY